MKKRSFGKLYKELFYIPKYEKLPDKVFRCRMVVSLLTILACTAVMAASTFALFYSEVSTDHSTLVGAYYSVTVDSAENGTYICPLAFEDKYTFEIKADGTATTGYCKIQVGEQVYYTEQIFQGHSLILTVQAAQGTPIIFTPGWGTLSEDTCGNEIIHSATPHTTYKVEPTAKLSSIAEHYGVSEADILVYNNLLVVTVAEVEDETAAPLLTVGMELKIPNPAENVEPYKVPYATYIIEPTATLDAISAHYNVSEEDILTYNEITEISVNMELNIPGVPSDTPPYVAPIPEAPTSADEDTGENTRDENTQSEKTQEDNNDPPVVDDPVSGGDVGTGEQSAEESTEESTEQPIEEPTEESAEQPIEEPIEESAEQAVEQTIGDTAVIESSTEDPGLADEDTISDNGVTE